MNHSVFRNRKGKAQRTPLLLVLLLLGALGTLWLVSRRHQEVDLVLGGPLFDWRNANIEGFLLTRGGAQYRFDKNEVGYWTLKGATSDFLDQGAVENMIAELKEAKGGRVLAGTEVEDRRYEFNSTAAIRLTIFFGDRQSQTLALGVINPVTHYYYASGCGRPGSFPVSEVLFKRLSDLPSTLQLHTLLPFFARKEIQEVEFWYGEEGYRLRKIKGRWWLNQPAKGLQALENTSAIAYHQMYEDRRLQYDGTTWLQANQAAVSLFIYQSSDITIKRFPDPRVALGRLQEWDLDPPWRRVKLSGTAINPDSTEASPDQLEISFGPALAGKDVPALRRGNVLMTEIEAIAVLNSPVGNFLEDRAISFLVSEGDTLRVRREGKLLLKGSRGKAPVVSLGLHQRPAVESWHTEYPLQSQRPDLQGLSYQALVRNFIVNLDRLVILRVWPQVYDPEVLKDKERVVVEVVYSRQADQSGVEPGVQRLEFGFLAGDHLPSGALAPVSTDDGIAPVAMWNPTTGKLLQVPSHILVTMRNHFTGLNQD